jgi:hypothetical protein
MLGGLDYHTIAGLIKRAIGAGLGYNAKGDIVVGTGTGTAAVKSTDGNGKVLVVDSTQNDGLIWTDYTRQPLNTNPNWLIDQINEGALYTVGASTQGPDGWTGSLVGAGVFKLRTLADPDNAARKVLEITCTTADAAIAATDKYVLNTAIEGYDAADLMAGTASAARITIQFPFKTNVTGVYGVAVQNSAANRRYIGTITVVDTDRHDYSVTLTLDTSGTWLYTSGIGLNVFFTLAAGSNFQDTAGAWAAGAHLTTSAQCNFMSSTSNIAYLGRFHVLPGGVALAYSSQDIQRELAKAQRYYGKTFNQGTAVAQAAGFGGALGGNGAITGGMGPTGNWRFKATMRATPTATTYNPTQANNVWRASDDSADVAVGATSGGVDGLTIAHAAAGSTGLHYLIHVTANARLS